MQDKLKNLSESHEDSNANSIDTDDALDIADLISKQPIVSVAQHRSDEEFFLCLMLTLPKGIS